MNKFLSSIALLHLALFMPATLQAGTFTSNGTGGGSWTTSSSWVFSGDADGIPDADDNITVLSGDIITWTVDGSCSNLTVNAGGTLTSGAATHIMTVRGDFTINGTETGSGSYSFVAPGTSIAGNGSHSVNSRWSFVNSRTIQSSVTATKNFYLRLYGATTVVTNMGNLTLYCISCMTNGATWLQGANGTIKLKNLPCMNQPKTGNFNAGANVNTVILDYTVNQAVPPAVSNTYYNLRLNDNVRRAYTTNDLLVKNSFYIGLNSIFTLNHNLTLTGSFSQFGGSGAFTQASGTTVTFAGSSAQTLSSQIPIDFQNMTVNKSAGSIVFSSAKVYNVLESLSLISGTLNVSATTNFNLISNASQTAVIGPSSSSANVTGTTKFNAQRFISSRSAGYSDMAGCMQGQTIADWDGELIMIYTYSPPSYYPSVWSYSETVWDYVPVTSSSTALTAGKGFEVYLDSDGSQTNFNNTTVINTGNPNIGTIDISSTVTDNNDGWNLVGNPYHANISWDALFATTSNISPDIMFYDETIEDFTTVSTGSGELIAPEQGFWVQATNTSPTLAFTEAIKSTSLSSNFRSTSAPLFTIRLKSVGGTRFTSGTSFRFANSPELAEKGDLPFKRLPHPLAPTLCSVSEEGKGLKINLINSSQEETAIPLRYTVGQDGIYTIEAQNIEPFNFENYTCALLTDKKTNRTVNLLEENYQFYAETSDDQNRFSLRLVKNGNCTNSSDAVAANNMIDINRQYDNTVVKLNFAEPTFAKITITDLLGQEIVPAQSVTATQQNVYLTIPDQFSGIYLVNVFYSGQVKSKKLFK